MAMLPLCNSILLRSVGARSLGNRTMRSKQSSGGSGDIFTSRIRAETLDFSRELCTNHCTKFNEYSEKIRSMMHQIVTSVAGIIINKNEIYG